MSDDYEVSIKLALDEDISIGVAALQRDLLQLDQAIAQSAAGLAQLRAVASLALADADADVRRAAGLTAAPAPRAAVRPKIEPEAPPIETPAAPTVMRSAPIAVVAVAAAPVELAVAVAPPARVAAKEVESGRQMTPVAPIAVPLTVAAPTPPTDGPARRDSSAAPAASAAAPIAAQVERATPTSTVLAEPVAPIMPILSNAPSALRTEAPAAPAPRDAGPTAKPVAPIAPAPSSKPTLALPAAPVAVPTLAVAVPPPLRSEAPMPAAERVTKRDMPSMPELASIGRLVMPSRPVDTEQAASRMPATPPPWLDDAVSRRERGVAVEIKFEDTGGDRRPGALLDEPRQSNMRREATAAMPTAYAPAAPSTATREQPTMSGDVILDGQKVGRWMSDRMTRDAGRPPNGPTGFDPSRSPAWPGATVA